MINVLVISGIIIYFLVIIAICIQYYGERRYWDGFKDGEKFERTMRELFTYEG